MSQFDRAINIGGQVNTAVERGDRAERRECARPAVKDFATVRNRSARTTEDAQPRSRTVMTYREPRPADLESVLEAALQEFESPILGCLRLRVDHVVRHQSTVNGPG
jgi:hypothetical protein